MHVSGQREISGPSVVALPKSGGLADALFDRARTHPHGTVVSRPGKGGVTLHLDAQQLGDIVMALAKGLLVAGVRFGDRVGVMSQPRYEWTLLDYALWSIGAVTVPVPYNAPVAQAECILGGSEAIACFVEDVEGAMTVGPLLTRLPGLRHLWQLDTGALSQLESAGFTVEDHDVHRHRLAVMPDTPASIVHTSGTMGRPKGFLITHGSMMLGAAGLVDSFAEVFRTATDSGAGILLHAPFENLTTRMTQVAAVQAGVPLAHQPSATPAELSGTLRVVRPSVLVTGTRTLERFVADFRRSAETGGRVGSFGLAVDVAVQYAEAKERKRLGTGTGPTPKLAVQHDVFDRGVYTDFRQMLGERLRHVLVCGSGVRRRLGLLWAGAGVAVHESYGLAEAGGPVTVGPPDLVKCGTAGRPLPGTSVHVDEDGQIWVHSDRNADSCGVAGVRGSAPAPEWLATGDVGRLDDDGLLTVLGRAEDALVTSDGRRVLPLPLEEDIRAHPLIIDCVVVGHGRPYAAALITLDTEAVFHWLRMCDHRAPTVHELPSDSALQSEITRAVLAANKRAPQGCGVRTFRLLVRQFTVEQGLLTSSLQPRRRQIEERFASDVDALYTT
ncbi:AMP-dependent synthetase/ligase [Streptomyces sp. NPDC008343]|uniref:AMP-dependent synthetase/ligase n=1 Tax=Streptomyces sp. NPDC008343 TaxID=3364828 RepID=UPI0036E49511